MFYIIHCSCCLLPSLWHCAFIAPQLQHLQVSAPVCVCVRLPDNFAHFYWDLCLFSHFCVCSSSSYIVFTFHKCGIFTWFRETRNAATHPVEIVQRRLPKYSGKKAANVVDNCKLIEICCTCRYQVLGRCIFVASVVRLYSWTTKSIARE